MKWLLKVLGRFLSLLYPYKVHLKLKGGLKVIYTAWISCGFFHCGNNVKFGFKVHLVGSKHIWLGNDIYYGDGGALTAFAINGVTPPRKLIKEPIIKIGNHCMFGDSNHLTAVNGITVGNNLRTGKNVLISDNSHGDPKDMSQRNLHPNVRPLYSKGEIIIGNNVWIGENAAILGGVVIGDGAIIGVNAVVTHDVPAYSTAVGVPAKIVASK